MKFPVVFSLSCFIALVLTLTSIRSVPIPAPIPIPVPIPRPFPAPIPRPFPVPYPVPIIYDKILGKLAVPAVIAGGYLATAAVGGVAGALAAKIHKGDGKKGHDHWGGGHDHWGFHDGLEHFGVGHHGGW